MRALRGRARPARRGTVSATGACVLSLRRGRMSIIHPRARRAVLAPIALLLTSASLTSCNYLRLLRPSVLKQLNPRVVRLVNELPATDQVNEAMIGRLFAHGGAGDARVGSDGVMRIAVNVPR